MRLSQLKQLVHDYDIHKGPLRRVFGDVLPIRVLKELIRDKELNDRVSFDYEVTLKEYQSFASRKGYTINLSDSYLNSNSLSATIFQQWKRELVIDLQLVPIRPIIINHEPLNLNISALSEISSNSIMHEISLATLPIERPAISIELTRLIEQRIYSRSSLFTLFQQPPQPQNSAPNYSHSTAESDHEDNDLDEYLRKHQAAPAA